ncbi:hypothetical protein U1769_16755 [Sphingomonas sp. ZT3P38]|uniref:hypothetical protein n=1 Tax=Parasphingomonas zepuensis TaxID=3096161 RepID=UPI002FCB3BF6
MTDIFGARSTADEILPDVDILPGVDLSGKRFFNTGVSSGVGLEAALAASVQ